MLGNIIIYAVCIGLIVNRHTIIGMLCDHIIINNYINMIGRMKSTRPRFTC